MRITAAAPVSSAAPLASVISPTNGENLLHLCARKAFIPVTKLLIECLGITPSKQLLAKQANNGLLPLHMACQRRGHLDSILLFIYAGVDLNLTDACGRTALHHCFLPSQSIHDYVAAIEDFAEQHGLLLTLPLKRPEVWSPNGTGQEVNHQAFAIRRMAQQFSGRPSAKFDTQDNDGASPAHLAAANGWSSILNVLFVRDGEAAENMARNCLILKDKNGNSVLSVVRTIEDKAGETIITAEMRKRCLDVFPAANLQSAISYRPLGSAAQLPSTQSAVAQTATYNSVNVAASPAIVSPTSFDSGPTVLANQFNRKPVSNPTSHPPAQPLQGPAPFARQQSYPPVSPPHIPTAYSHQANIQPQYVDPRRSQAVPHDQFQRVAYDAPQPSRSMMGNPAFAPPPPQVQNPNPIPFRPGHLQTPPGPTQPNFAQQRPPPPSVAPLLRAPEPTAPEKRTSKLFKKFRK